MLHKQYHQRLKKNFDNYRKEKTSMDFSTYDEFKSESVLDISDKASSNSYFFMWNKFAVLKCCIHTSWYRLVLKCWLTLIDKQCKILLNFFNSFGLVN